MKKRVDLVAVIMNLIVGSTLVRGDVDGSSVANTIRRCSIWNVSNGTAQ